MKQARSLLVNGFDQATVDTLLNQVRTQYPVTDPSLGPIDTLALSEFTEQPGCGEYYIAYTSVEPENTEEQNIRLDYPMYLTKTMRIKVLFLQRGAPRSKRQGKAEAQFILRFLNSLIQQDYGDSDFRPQSSMVRVSRLSSIPPS